MKIKQDPITRLWCREDGAVLMPPCRRFKVFRWTFGSAHGRGYRHIGYCGKIYLVHQIVCRAFNGIPPADKPFVDHINRIRDDNRPSNLHWVSTKENCDNTGRVDQALEKYGVRCCESSKAYQKAYRESHREECKAYDKAYYEAHREEVKARHKAYRERRKSEAA